MAYSKCAISIPNVTGDISITVHTAISGFAFDMNREEATAPTDSVPFWNSSKSNLWDENKVYKNINWAGGDGSANYIATLSNKTENSVTVQNPGQQYGALYPVKVTGGKTYSISFHYAGNGSARVFYSTNIDGTVSAIHKVYSGVDQGDNVYTGSITIPSGTECWLFLTFGANTSKVKSYTNVSLTEEQ